MPGDAYRRVHEIAVDQHGYFTTEQAAEANVGRHSLAKMCERGTIQRLAQGVYLDTLAPASTLGPYMAATLWPRGTRGVLSHQTALALLDLSDVSPDRIHLTIPPQVRVRRTVPRQYVLHHASLEPREITYVEGIPVTTAYRAIRDCHAAHLGAALLRQAIEDGRRTGRLSAREAEILEQEILMTGDTGENASG